MRKSKKKKLKNYISKKAFPVDDFRFTSIELVSIQKIKCAFGEISYAAQILLHTHRSIATILLGKFESRSVLGSRLGLGFPLSQRDIVVKSEWLL